VISGLELFSHHEMETLHEESLTLLEKKGVIFQSDEAVEIFKKGGARVDGKLVFIPREMVNWALMVSPKTFVLSAVNPERSVTVGEGMLIHPTGGEVFVDDTGTGQRRAATLEDYRNLQKIYQYCPNMDMTGYQPVSISDADPRLAGLYGMYETMLYTDKPWLAPMDLRDIKQKQACVRMYEIAMGEDFVKNHYVTWHLVSPESPLIYPPTACEGIIEFAKKNQPVAISPAPMNGLTGPISLYGNILLSNTETLAAICLAQLVKEGIPILSSGSLMCFNMRYATSECAGPDAALMTSGYIQLHRQYYHLPVRAHSGITSSKKMDYQAGYEHTLSFLLNALSGVNVVSQAMGCLDNLMTVSYEKTVIDDELVERVRRTMDGVTIDDASRSIDVIMEVGHGENYILHDSTLMSYKQNWEPRFSDWEPYEIWEESGKVDIERKARTKVKEILEYAEKPILDEDTAQQLKRFINEN